MTLKQLSEAAFAIKRRKYPNIPENLLPMKKFSDKSANALTAAILFYFEAKGIKAWRQQSGGRYLQEVKATNVIGQTITLQKGKFIPQGKRGGKGAGDISIVYKSRFISLEIKIGKDRQSQDQKIFQKEIEESGGVYLIVKTWDDFIVQITKIING